MTTQLTLSDDLAPVDFPYPDRILYMRRIYGADDAHRCETCVNLLCNPGHTKNYYKCAIYGTSFSDATDWRQKWPACGLWQQWTPADSD